MSYCGIYVHGYARPFVLRDNLRPIINFFNFSATPHPLYLFYADAGDIGEAIKYFPAITPIQISPMQCIGDYDTFMLRSCFHIVKEEKTLTFHDDGYLLKSGWEAFAEGFDYLGASWRHHIPDFDFHYKGNAFAKFKGYKKIKTTTTVGNGGFCFRRKSKMLEVERSVNWKTKKGNWLPDDIFYSFYGFGQNIFKPVTIEIADQWSLEPGDTDSPSYGFHGK